MALDGRLGPVRQGEDDQSLVIWPPELQTRPDSELPEVGSWLFGFIMSVPLVTDNSDTDQFEAAQKSFLSLAHAVGDPIQAAENAEAMLYHSGYVLQWTIFEVFLRESVIDLIRRHPAKIASGKRRKNTITYEELAEKSRGFQSLEVLRDYLIDAQLQEMHSSGSSVHGMINFIKDEFRFDEDPYNAWYRFHGDRRTAHYNTLMAIKNKRNALVYEGGIGNKEGAISAEAVTYDEYQEAALVLRSVAYSIADSIATGKYRPN